MKLDNIYSIDLKALTKQQRSGSQIKLQQLEYIVIKLLYRDKEYACLIVVLAYGWH